LRQIPRRVGGFQDDAHALTIVTLQPLATIRSTADAGSRNLGTPVGEHASARELANLAALYHRYTPCDDAPFAAVPVDGLASQHGTVLQLVPFVCLGLDGGQDDGEAAFPTATNAPRETPPKAGQRA
jgi:hypothetical protein